MFFYVNVFKTLQIKKIELLKIFLLFDNVRKTFFNRIKINNFTFLKIELFRILQFLFFQSSYLIYYNFLR